jgi:hydroxymethylbilane synthase
LSGEGIPAGLRATFLSPAEVLPCVGQAAIGIEVREGDAAMSVVCAGLNDLPTWQCVTAERAFLRATGGGCQSPVGGYAEIRGNQIWLRAVSYLGEDKARRVEMGGAANDSEKLGEDVAAALKT